MQSSLPGVSVSKGFSGHVKFEDDVKLDDEPVKPDGDPGDIELQAGGSLTSAVASTFEEERQPDDPASHTRRGGMAARSASTIAHERSTVLSFFQETSMKLLENLFFVNFCRVLLVFSVIAKDLWNVIGVPKHPGDTILVCLLLLIALLFVIEIAFAWVLSNGAYRRSPAFVVDILSILSVVAECYGLGRTRTGENAIISSLDGTFSWPLLESLCMLKRMKFSSYFNGGAARLPEWHPKRKQTDVITGCLKAFSQRVPMFTIILVAGMPLLKLEWTDRRMQMLGMDSWMGLLQDSWRKAEDEKSPTIFDDQVERMERYFAGQNFFPYKIEGFETDIIKEVKVERSAQQVLEDSRSEYVHVENVERCKKNGKCCEDNLAEGAKIHFFFKSYIRLTCGENIVVKIFSLVLLQYVLLEVKWTLKSIEKMEKFANMTRMYLKPKHMDHLEYDKLNLESKGVLKLMGCDTISRRRTSSTPPMAATNSKSQKGFNHAVGKDVVHSWHCDVCNVPETAKRDMTLPQFQERITTYLFYVSPFGASMRQLLPADDTCMVFIAALRELYTDAPYHNFSHALDVCLTVYNLLRESMCDQWVSELEKLSLLVAALGHDVGHFGRTNDFLVQSCHAWALQYNDQSPLENMHCFHLFNIFQNDRANMFKMLSTESYVQARKLIIAAILHTDMVHHPTMMKHLALLYERTSEVCDLQAKNNQELEYDFQEEVLISEQDFWLQSVFLHVADVSSPAKPFGLCKAWAEKCLNEFWDQGDEEKKLGYPVGMLNDRSKVSLPGSQHGFITFLVAPVILGMCKIFQPLLPLSRNMVENMTNWKDIWQNEVMPAQSEIQKRHADILRVRDAVQLIEARGSTYKKKSMVEELLHYRQQLQT